MADAIFCFVWVLAQQPQIPLILLRNQVTVFRSSIKPANGNCLACKGIYRLPALLLSSSEEIVKIIRNFGGDTDELFFFKAAW